MTGDSCGATVPGETWEAELLARAWPGGLPQEERLHLASLPAERRRETLLRLDAVTRDAGSVAERARIADLGASAFYDLRKAWEAERSLRSLVRYAGRKRPARAYEALRDAARGVIAADATLSNEAVARRLATGTDAPSMFTLRRIVADARREMTRGGDLSERFGRSFLLAYSTVDLALRVSPGAGAEWADAAMVVEEASGLIVGRDLGPANESVRLMKEAIRDAADRATLFGLSAPAWRDGPPGLRVVMGAENETFLRWARMRKLLSDRLGEGNVAADRATRFERHVIPGIGHAVGGLKLRPRRTADPYSRAIPPARAAKLGIHVTGDAQALLAREVDRYNEPIVARLRAVGLVGAEPSAARPLVEVLSALAG